MQRHRCQPVFARDAGWEGKLLVVRFLLASLRLRLLLLVLVALLPVFGLLLYSARLQREQEVATYYQEAVRLARMVSFAQQYLLTEMRRQLADLTSREDLRQADPAYCDLQLRRVREANPLYAQIGWIALNGDTLCTAVPVTSLINIADREYFVKALATGDFATGGYVIGRSTGRPTLNAGYPRRDAAGQIVGIAYIALDLIWLDRLIASNELPKGATLTVSDGTGRMLAHYPDPAASVGELAPWAERAAAALARGETIGEATGDDGVAYLNAYVTLPVSQTDQPVLVVLSIPRATVYAESNAILARTLVGSVLVALFAFAVAWLGSDLIVLRRIRRLMHVANQLRSGDLDARVGEEAGNDELGALGRAFDDMAVATQRRATELRQANSFLQSVLENIPHMIFVKDARDLRFVRVNAAGERLMGYPREALLGKNDHDFFPREEADFFTGTDRAVLSSGKLHDVPEETLHSGLLGERLLHTKKIPLLDPEGRPEYLLGISEDITERKQAEQALRESEERFRSIFNHAGLGIAIYTPEGHIIAANGAYSRFLGYTPEELQGVHFSEFTRAEDTPTSGERFGRIIAGEIEQYTVEKRYRRKDGELVWGQATVSRLCGADGQSRGAIVVSEDIQERKQFEEQRYALTEAEKLRALGQMASGVAHDLNQYLALIAGHADLARAGLERSQVDTGRLRDALDTIGQAATDGAESVRRLQRFARPQGDQPAERCDVSTLLAEVAKLTAPHWRDAAQASGRAIRVQVETEADLVIDGWSESLREALTNLVFNAVDALPRGGNIRLVGRRQGEQVEVTVTDDGNGMSPEVQARVFEPFFTTKGARGTGLGLAMVFGIVERHHGTIGVVSAVGQGTTFRLSLPAAAAAAAAPAAPLLAAQASPLRVLAVDDEPALGNVMAAALALDGHQVSVVTSGEAALACLEQEPFDLLISDVGMPNMNGWELTAAVRQRWPAVRLLLATGWGAEIDPEQARAHGIDGVLAKPYRVSELRRRVSALGNAMRASAA